MLVFFVCFGFPPPFFLFSQGAKVCICDWGRLPYLPHFLILWSGFYCSYRLHGDVQEGGNNVDHMCMNPSTTHLAAGSWTPSALFLFFFWLNRGNRLYTYMFDVAIALEVCWLITHCRSWQIYVGKIITRLRKKRSQTSFGANKTCWGKNIRTTISNGSCWVGQRSAALKLCHRKRV